LGMHRRSTYGLIYSARLALSFCVPVATAGHKVLPPEGMLSFLWVFAESSGRIWGMKAEESCAFLSDFGFRSGLRFGIRDG
jgi:hypothetical protein